MVGPVSTIILTSVLAMEDRAASTIFIKHHVAACMEDILHDINQVEKFRSENE
jgi:hypothetical protein